MGTQSTSGDFFDMLSSFAKTLSPIIGIVVLILVAIALWEIIKLLKGLDTTMNKVNKTIDSIDTSVEKLQAPLDTIESISYTVDSVHSFTKRSVEKSVEMVSENFHVVKDWATSLFSKDKHNEEVSDLDIEIDIVDQNIDE